MTGYVIAIASLTLIYALLALGLNLQWGHTGIINFGHVAFFAAGAYTSALLTLAGAPIIIGVVAGAICGGILVYPLGWLTLRLKEDYLAVVTIGFAEVLRLILLNSVWSGSANGLPGVPRMFVSYGREMRPVLWLALMGIVIISTIFLMMRLTESPFGRVLRAIRSDEVAAASLGKDVAWFRMVSLMVGSMLAGLAGALYAHWVGFVVPEQFTTLVTFATWTGIILGGSSHVGAVAGTIVLVALLESTRFLADFGLPIDSTRFANLRFILVGILLVVMLQARPEGLWPYKHKHLSRALGDSEDLANLDGVASSGSQH